ncbi:hypothetical protein [Nannocystis radixulma]|uniref:HNH endonuclease n=1 Tax=Nannocystis radixulma TaxID=2995305 RepID=A0ABT5BDK9_9BACT|nr:hypothetical protein [Nannocystis radixulma]MDC0672234.1 hypothetical protein [Nannocystis radixulma]
MSRAKSKRWDFELTEDDFKECAQSVCTYCGDALTYAAFDRCDSSKGYTKANSIPCCEKCNFLKNKYTENDFLDKVFKIALNFDPPERTMQALVARYPDGYQRGDFELNETLVLRISIVKIA